MHDAATEIERLRSHDKARPRCDAYSIAGSVWEGVTFCRKGGARVAHDVGKALDEANDTIKRLRGAFSHTHVAGPPDAIDRCARCGLDLRDKIHAGDTP